MRILIAEDDAVLADGLVRAMKGAGYIADLVTNGEDADSALMRQVHDLVVLDLGLPGLDGLQVLQRLRERKSSMPVLILTARATLDDRVKGLDLGADDYIAKPCDIQELQARVRALLRRAYNKSSNVLTHGRLSFDTEKRRVTLSGNPFEMTAREMRLFELLLRRAGSVVSKEQILESLCSWDEEVSDNAIEVSVHRLRKRLGETGIIIRTIRGLGYLLDDPADA